MRPLEGYDALALVLERASALQNPNRLEPRSVQVRLTNEFLVIRRANRMGISQPSLTYAQVAILEGRAQALFETRIARASHRTAFGAHR